MLKQEKERSFDEQKALREKWHRDKLLLDQKIDDLRIELNKRDDMIRRLEFEVEKAGKIAAYNNVNPDAGQMIMNV